MQEGLQDKTGAQEGAAYAAKRPLDVGEEVLCLANCIDQPAGKGSRGRVTGFARLSGYHPREVMIEGIGWFWERDVARVTGEP